MGSGALSPPPCSGESRFPLSLGRGPAGTPLHGCYRRRVTRRLPAASLRARFARRRPAPKGAGAIRRSAGRLRSRRGRLQKHRVGAHPMFFARFLPRTPAALPVRRLQLREQLAAAAHRAPVDARRRQVHRLILGLLRVARHGRHLVGPVLALVEARALRDRDARRLVRERKTRRRDRRQRDREPRCAHDGSPTAPG